VNSRRTLLLAARVLFAGQALLAGVYCLLAYVPFTYHQIHHGSLLPALDLFARYHPWIHAPFCGLLLCMLFEYFRIGGKARSLATACLALEAGSGILFLVHPVLKSLRNDASSFFWGLAILAPLAILILTDIIGSLDSVHWTRQTGRQSARLFYAACGSAFLSWIVFAIVVQYRRSEWITSAKGLLALAGSLAAHLVLFLLLFLILEWISALVEALQPPAAVEFWLAAALLACLAGAFVYFIVCPAIGFHGWSRGVGSFALGALVSGLNASLSVWVRRGQMLGQGLALPLTTLQFGVESPKTAAAALVAAGVGCGLLAIKAAAMDWNNLLQMTTAALLWAIGFALCYVLAKHSRGRIGIVTAGAVILSLGGYKALASHSPRSEADLETWETYDASLHLAQRILASASHGENDFYQFVTRNTNIPESVHVTPIDLKLVDHLEASQAKKPHIFVFVIDSLRRDYLSPYNESVAFTPNIEKFAQESAVFRNAFTRYGATGLSEPSIWAGAVLLHKQYIQPFAPINTLEKLVRAEGYQLVLSQDEVLSAILQPTPNAVHLDPPGETMGLDLVKSLQKLTQFLQRRTPGAPPVFVYTQPQNIHISVIQREGAKSLDSSLYSGFYAPYASRIRRMDEGFGQFLDDLKAQHLYDDSIIVLTADHGDSLGEEGRWGHAYTIYPEVVRIPLIIHLPPWLASEFHYDATDLAFSIDISPTLYYLLGHAPTLHSPLVGETLFTKQPGERPARATGSYLTESSYGPVYGILSKNGTELFISDAVNYKDALFELHGNSQRQVPFSETFAEREQGLIRESVKAVNRFYGYRSDSPVASGGVVIRTTQGQAFRTIFQRETTADGRSQNSFGGAYAVRF
jgi:hypothetical protein